MSRKFDFIPHIPDYNWVRQQMQADLNYRLQKRHEKTSLGRPLYYRINIQIVMTRECPYHCSFCLDRLNPMHGLFDADAQIDALRRVLAEHPSARLTITGGEPGLYPEHVRHLVEVYQQHSQNVFCNINTAGYDPSLSDIAHVNLSVNDYVKPDPSLFPGCTVQTVLTDDKMRLENIKRIMDSTNAQNFSFRYLSSLHKHDYDIIILNQIQNDPETQVTTFRVGDFFLYAIFNYHGKHARITLGDMYQQKCNKYQDGYSNIIIHPDGRIGINWQ